MTRRIPTGYLRNAMLCLVTALGYFGGAELGMLFNIDSTNISPVWPPSGIALAAILLFGYRVVPGIIVGSLCFNLAEDFYNPVSFVSTAGETLQAVAAAWLVTRFGGGADSFGRVRDACVFLVFGGMVATIVSCSIGAPAYAAAGSFPWADLPRIWVVWWLGDAVGIITVAPLILLWARSSRILWTPAVAGELGLFLAVLSLAGYLVFLDPFELSGRYANTQVLLLPMIMWAAIRLGPRDCITAICLVAVMAIIGTDSAHGPFVRSDATADLSALQFHLAVYSVTCLVVGAAWQERKVIQKVLENVEAKYRNLYDNAPDMFYSMDIETREITNCNETFATSLGYSKAEIVGQPLDRFYDARSLELLNDSIQLFRQTGISLVGDRWLRRRDGGSIVVSLKSSPIRDIGGRVIGAQAIMRDITQQYEAEWARQRAERQYQELYDNAPDMFLSLDLSSRRIAICNETFARSLGYTKAEVIGQPIERYVDDRSKAVSARSLSKFFQAGEPTIGHRWMKRRDGSSFIVNLRASPIRDGEGNVVGVQGIMRDVTQQHKAEEARREAEESVRQSEARLAEAQKLAHVGSWNLDLRTGRMEWSDEMHAICGIPRKEFAGTFDAWVEPVHPEDRPKAQAAFENALRCGTGYEVDIRLRMKDGRVKHVRERGKVMRENDVPIRCLGTVQDLTEQRDAMNQVTRLGRIIEDSNNEIYVFDAESLRYTQVNRGARDNLGYSIDELCSMTPLDLTQGYTMETFDEVIRPLRRGRRHVIEFETVHRRKDGSTYDVAVRLQFTQTDLRPSFLAIIEDITAEKQAEARFKTIFESAPSGMVMVDRAGTIILANSRIAELFGYGSGELVGKGIEELMPARLRSENPARLEKYFETPKTVLLGRDQAIHGLRKDGTEVIVEIGLNPMPAEHGGYVLASVVDVTARNQAEATIRRSLAEKEVLLREVHHRVKNNLQVVSSMLSLQSQGLADPHIVAAIRDSEVRVRAMAMIHELLHQSEKLDQIEFHCYVEKLVDHLGRSQNAAARGIRLYCRADPVMLKLDLAMPCGLLINELVSNGLKHAFPAGRTGEICVSVGQEDDLVSLSIADTGIGLTAPVEGLGGASLGLKLARAVSMQIGGELVCESDQHGTRFSVEFELFRDSTREKAA